MIKVKVTEYEKDTKATSSTLKTFTTLIEAEKFIEIFNVENRNKSGRWYSVAKLMESI